MIRCSYLSSAVGLLLVFSLNGDSPVPKDSITTISPEKNESIYCRLDNCPDDKAKPHYGCNNTEKWSPACGKEPKLITVTEKIESFLVMRHNTFRDVVASGVPLKLPVAGRMRKLRWDRDLADVAKLLVMRCDLRPTNSCISTKKFSAPGANEIYNKFKKKENALGVVKSQLNAWYDEYKKITLPSLLDGSALNNSEVGHFLRMMVGFSNRLGCAMAATEKDGWNYQWLTCLYSCSLPPGENTLLYEFAATPGEYCTTGVDDQFQNLCSDQELSDSCEPTPNMFGTFMENDPASQIGTSMNQRPMIQRRVKLGKFGELHANMSLEITIPYLQKGTIVTKWLPPNGVQVYITFRNQYADCTYNQSKTKMACNIRF